MALKRFPWSVHRLGKEETSATILAFESWPSEIDRLTFAYSVVTDTVTTVMLPPLSARGLADDDGKDDVKGGVSVGDADTNVDVLKVTAEDADGTAVRLGDAMSV